MDGRVAEVGGRLDLLKDHRDDFPPQYPRWVEEGQRLSALDFDKGQEIRTEIYDAVRGVLNEYDLQVTPTLACLPVDNTDDGSCMAQAGSATRWSRAPGDEVARLRHDPVPVGA